VKHARSVTILLALCVAASGCLMTQKDGDELRTATAALDRRVAALEADVQAKQLALQAKLSELEQGIERAKSMLTRDSADVGVQVQDQQQKLAELDGKLDELQHQLSDLTVKTAQAQATVDDKLTKLSTAKPTAVDASAVDPSAIPADKGAHFAAAYEAYKAGDHDKARALFGAYLTRYADDDKAGDAQYWIGASYLVQNKPATALGEYRKVIALYPKSAAVDTALYGMGDAFFRLHACTDAKGAIDALIKHKPSKALADRAKDLLKAVTDAPQGYCTS
jgi:TolA-binding protein